MSATLYSSVAIPHSELQPDRHLPSYMLGSFTTMASKVWNMTRVTVREGDERLLAREMEIMTSMSHPQLLLLMGHCPPNQRQKLKLVYEPVIIGSLYHYLHDQGQHLPLLHVVDILLQVTDGLMYLAGRGFVHRAITSHAVQLINKGVAKLGMLEMTVKEGKVVSRPLDTGWQCLYNWLSPEVLLNEQSVAQKEGDVYSLCCLLWELCMQEVPWEDRDAREITSLMSEGVTLQLCKDRMPRLLFRVMRQGLVWDVNLRDLDLEEVRDMLLLFRGQQENKMARIGANQLHENTLMGTSIGQRLEPRGEQGMAQKWLQPSQVLKTKIGTSMTQSLDPRVVQETRMGNRLEQSLEPNQVHETRSGSSREQRAEPRVAQMMRMEQRMRSRAMYENLGLRGDSVTLNAQANSFPLSDLNLFTSSALQTDIKRYLGNHPAQRQCQLKLEHPKYGAPPASYYDSDSDYSGDIGHDYDSDSSDQSSDTIHVDNRYDIVLHERGHPDIKGIGIPASKSSHPSFRSTQPAVTMPGNLKIPPAYRRRSCPVFEGRSGSGPCQGAEEEGRPSAGGLCEAADRRIGAERTNIFHGLEKRVGFNHPAIAKRCIVSGKSSGLTRSEVMRCLTRKTVSLPSTTPSPGIEKGTNRANGDRNESETEQDYYNTNFREKFLLSKEFFEKTAMHQKKQLAECSELYLTPRGSSKSGTQTSPPGTFLRYWTCPPADHVAAVPEVCPPAGAVHDAVTLFENQTLRSGHALLLSDESCYLSAADSPTIQNLEKSPRPTFTKRSSVVTSNAQKATKSTQTFLPTPALSHSTPITSHHHHCPPTFNSPMLCSPLLPSHPIPRPVSGLLKLNSMDQASMDSIRYVQPISSASNDNNVGIDFSDPVGRQTAFTTALGQASQDTTSSGHFDTCTEFAQEVTDEKNVLKDKIRPRSPQVVTFNSSVEEITTSIVSLEPDSQAVSSSSSQDTVRMSGSGTETVDFYCDDELHPSLQLDPNNMQLMSTQVSKDWEEEEEQYNTAELAIGVIENDSTSSDYCEVGTKTTLNVAIARPVSSSNYDIEEDDDNEVTKYGSIIESTVLSGEEIFIENGIGDGRKELKSDHKRRQSKFMQDKQDDDEWIQQKDNIEGEGPVESNITGEIEISVAYEEANNVVENDIDGYEEDWGEDEINQNNVEGMDEGELREASAYEEAISSVENDTTNDYEDDWNNNESNRKRVEEINEVEFREVAYEEEASSLIENDSNAFEEHWNIEDRIKGTTEETGDGDLGEITAYEEANSSAEEELNVDEEARNKLNRENVEIGECNLEGPNSYEEDNDENEKYINGEEIEINQENAEEIGEGDLKDTTSYEEAHTQLAYEAHDEEEETELNEDINSAGENVDIGEYDTNDRTNSEEAENIEDFWNEGGRDSDGSGNDDNEENHDECVEERQLLVEEDIDEEWG